MRLNLKFKPTFLRGGPMGYFYRVFTTGNGAFSLKIDERGLTLIGKTFDQMYRLGLDSILSNPNEVYRSLADITPAKHKRKLADYGVGQGGEGWRKLLLHCKFQEDEKL